MRKRCRAALATAVQDTLARILTTLTVPGAPGRRRGWGDFFLIKYLAGAKEMWRPVRQSQRDCLNQPKVGASAPTLGSSSEMESTSTRLWPGSVGVRERQGRNRVAVGKVCWTMTQGSLASSATLGFRTESRWDSDWRRAGCAGMPPQPGWFFLDKIFGGRKLKIAKP